MHRNEKHWLTDEEVETGTFGQSLELSVVEIRNMLPLLEEAFSGVEFMAGAIRSKELGFERSGIFWPVTFPNMECFGMAWTDGEAMVADIEPPPDIEEGWKLDPHYGDRLRFWFGDKWDLVAAPAPGNLDIYRRIAAGEDVDEAPDPPPVHPANSDEPHPVVEMLQGDSASFGQRTKPPIRDVEDEVSPVDLKLAEEIARFVADRALEFDDTDARAWALTDFSVWSVLAGKSPELSFAPDTK